MVIPDYVASPVGGLFTPENLPETYHEEYNGKDLVWKMNLMKYRGDIHPFTLNQWNEYHELTGNEEKIEFVILCKAQHKQAKRKADRMLERFADLEVG